MYPPGPKPGRNRRKFKHGRRNYAKGALKSRYSEKHSAQRKTRQARKVKIRQQTERLDLVVCQA